MLAGKDTGKPAAAYSAETRGIRVSVEPFYLDSQSEPSDNHYVWAYKVRIENTGPDIVQLRNRYWHITDARGVVKEVRGAGVVGEQPVLRPGETFEYTSGTPLTTASGIMAGTYEMQTAAGEMFEAQIPTFSLDSPHQRRSLH
ncbi:MAG: Co2+/Mg2+ efflux protein ApaG [Alphaproteobacteria bacterium]